jgi:ABC-2 type transport system ATP-binding protein
MSNAILLQANNIHKAYSNHVALNDVSVSIKQGSVFGLLGPNGAGKTSLIRIINQITAPDSGEVLFNNERLQAKHIAHIGYLPEERGLYKQMKVGEQALYLAQLKGLSKQEALKRLKYWFEKFEIETWWNKKIEELSKGMQQKVQFVVTILHEPQLLILDEPFSGFDPINASLLKQEILELKAKGTTIMFSSHNMESVEQLCDDVVLINKSRKVLDGSVIDIKNQYKTNMFKIDFVGSMLGFTNALWTSGEIITKNELPTHNSVTIKTLANSTLNDALANVLSAVQLIGVQEVIPSLNEIFIKTVGSKLNANEVLTE